MNTITSLFLVGLFSVAQAHAAIINFDLTGVAGNGLLAGNEPGVVSGGSGWDPTVARRCVPRR